MPRAAATIVALLIGVTGAAVAAPVSSGSPRSEAAHSRQVVDHTRVIRISPVTREGHLSHGFHVTHRDGRATCWTQSIAVAHAFRCMNGRSSILDPCWVQRVTGHWVICLEAPWERKVVRLHVTKGFAHLPRGERHPEPWAMTTMSGVHCVQSQGASDEVGKYGISYPCDRRRALLAEPDRRVQPWTMHQAKQAHNHWRLAGEVRIARAFYGRRSLNP